MLTDTESKASEFVLSSQFDTAKVLPWFADQKNMFQKMSADTLFIYLTLGLVLLLAVPTFQTLTEPDSELSREIAAHQEVTALRQPSSIPPSLEQSPAQTLSLSAFASHDLNCRQKKTAEVRVDSEYLQLEGRNCLGDGKSLDVEIVNRSNGYTASVFSKNGSQYQTDFIQLQKGTNEILIRFHDLSGRLVEELIQVYSTHL